MAVNRDNGEVYPVSAIRFRRMDQDSLELELFWPAEVKEVDDGAPYRTEQDDRQERDDMRNKLERLRKLVEEKNEREKQQKRRCDELKIEARRDRRVREGQARVMIAQIEESQRLLRIELGRSKKNLENCSNQSATSSSNPSPMGVDQVIRTNLPGTEAVPMDIDKPPSGDVFAPEGM